ncbi:helix-turn-helix transcriptional regulator [Cohnella hashimotonis]|uniref:Helix-turn-helix transcriptional regulator n=1 Tax=Cohnella hashimotonis TaxID=2826895 RepID=A0ABT6TVY0_9BACL|nr:helix-turn-helix transcriptional regulator [Cohnella hashimotonis]MDI4650124.1 helix-turn-helix transcriptional regulator [Cohnella hashimotonis]
MTVNISYTTEEIAQMLKISKLTVYDLIKKGELPSYRVGKQMRVDAADLEAYKLRMRSPASQAQHRPPAEAETARGMVLPQPAASSVRPLVITGQDMSLDLLAKHLEGNPGAGGVRPLRAYAGSLDSLIAMYRGEADIVSTHLYDGDTGEYNLPYIRRILIGAPYMVVRLLGRTAGLYVQRGNPLGLADWPDLARPGLRLANRERGAGARVLLEEQLRIGGIRASGIAGYADELTSHMAVAAKVAAGEADFGVGIEKAAAIVGRIDFIPLIQESYDLVALKTPANLPWIEGLLAALRSDLFRRELAAIPGYDLSRTGEIIYED